MYISLKRKLNKISNKLNIKKNNIKVIVIETDKPYTKEYTTIINGKKKHFDDYEDYLEQYVYKNLTPREKRHIRVIINDLPNAE